MTNANYQIDLYDEKKVGARVKRLATCFNAAADLLGSRSIDEKDIIRTGVELFKSVTKKNGEIILNEDEEAYLRTKFLIISAKMQTGRQIGWSTVEEVVCEKAESLMAEAVKKKIVTFERNTDLL